MRCSSSTAHGPQAVWQCIAAVQLPIAPLGSVAVHHVHNHSSTAQCSQAVWECIAAVPLPTVCGGGGGGACGKMRENAEKCGFVEMV